MFSDGIGGRLKALASTKLKVETANRQSSNRVRAYRTRPSGKCDKKIQGQSSNRVRAYRTHPTYRL